MMEATTLAPPKSGRSRFSKALPAPPSLPAFDFESSLSPIPPEKALPRLQPETTLPPPRPPRKELRAEREAVAMAATAKPLVSPLPPLPSKLAGPAPMTVPRRRPVAAPVTPAPSLAPTATPALASPNPAPSPVGSISSLLSAYSNHTTDSSSARDVGSSKNSYSIVSPNLDSQRTSATSETHAYAPPPLQDHNAQKHEPNGHQKIEADLGALPPPLPQKDAQRGLPRPQTPTSLQTQLAQPTSSPRVGSPLGTGSPQQDQLWRRRSIKTDKTLAVPELKLVSSHGSTAASAQATLQPSQPFPLGPRSNPEASEPAPTPRAPPRSANGGLPGRNIRPVVASEQNLPTAETSMGQEASRLKQKMENGRRREAAEEQKAESQETQRPPAATPAMPRPATSPMPAQRLPTPEYATADVRSPVLDTVVSPLSPVSSPELPGEPKVPIARKAVGATEHRLRPAKSSQSLAPGSVNSGLGARSPVGLPTSPRPGHTQGPEQTQASSTSPTLDRDQVPNQPQYSAYSPKPAATQASNQKQYIPYSPPLEQNLDVGRSELPGQPAASGFDESALPAPPPLSALPAVPQKDTWARSPTRDAEPRSETGSVETLKAPLPQVPRQAELDSFPLPPSAVQEEQTPIQHLVQTLRSPDNQPDLNNAPAAATTTTTTSIPNPSANQDHPPDDDAVTTTDNPGAARFPRGWYTTTTLQPHLPSPNGNSFPQDAPPPPSFAPRHLRCLTNHRYLTANRQRVNPVACRTCGRKDRTADCFICSACYLNVCGGCAGLVRRFRGDLGSVVREREKEAVAGGGEGGEVEREG